MTFTAHNPFGVKNVALDLSGPFILMLLPVVVHSLKMGVELHASDLAVGIIIAVALVVQRLMVPRVVSVTFTEREIVFTYKTLLGRTQARAVLNSLVTLKAKRGLIKRTSFPVALHFFLEKRKLLTLGASDNFSNEQLRGIVRAAQDFSVAVQLPDSQKLQAVSKT